MNEMGDATGGMRALPEGLPAGSLREGALRVVVDLNRCQGYAQCCFAAPAHFAIEGHEALAYDPAPPAHVRADIERARISCPVQAIRVQDPTTAPAGGEL